MIDYQVTSRAILLHQNKTSKAVEITTHDIITIDHNRDGKPGYTLGAGHVFGAEQKAELAAILSDETSASSLSIIPEEIIAQTPYAVVWWMPSAVRELLVKHEGEIKTFVVKMPSTVAAMCRGRLYVAAIKGNQRPNAETPLYRMPITNLTSDFQFCMGNLRPPIEANAEHIPAWSSCIWDSVNTHLGKSPLKNINDKDEYVRFLEGLHGTSRFPANKLIETEGTLGKLLTALETQG